MAYVPPELLGSGAPSGGLFDPAESIFRIAPPGTPTASGGYGPLASLATKGALWAGGKLFGGAGGGAGSAATSAAFKPDLTALGAIERAPSGAGAGGLFSGAGLANFGGGIAGGFLGDMIGGFGRNTGGQIGGGIGSAGGAALGQLLIPIPGVGAAIGAFGGNLLGRGLGGLFGGKPSVGPGGSYAGLFADGGLKGQGTSGDNGFDPNSLSGIAAPAISAVNALKARGATVAPGAEFGIAQRPEGMGWSFTGENYKNPLTGDFLNDYLTQAISRGVISGAGVENMKPRDIQLLALSGGR